MIPFLHHDSCVRPPGRTAAIDNCRLRRLLRGGVRIIDADARRSSRTIIMLRSRETRRIGLLVATSLVLLSTLGSAQTLAAPATKPAPSATGTSLKAKRHGKTSQPVAETPQPAPAPP